MSSWSHVVTLNWHVYITSVCISGLKDFETFITTTSGSGKIHLSHVTWSALCLKSRTTRVKYVKCSAAGHNQNTASLTHLGESIKMDRYILLHEGPMIWKAFRWHDVILSRRSIWVLITTVQKHVFSVLLVCWVWFHNLLLYARQLELSMMLFCRISQGICIGLSSSSIACYTHDKERKVSTAYTNICTRIVCKMYQNDSSYTRVAVA